MEAIESDSPAGGVVPAPLSVVVSSIAGTEVLSLEAVASTTSVREIRARVVVDQARPCRVRLLHGGRSLDDATVLRELGGGGGRLGLTAVLLEAAVELDRESAVGVLVSDDGLLGVCGGDWACARARDPLPAAGGPVTWTTTVQRVTRIGDVALGVWHGSGEALVFYVVGSQSGRLGVVNLGPSFERASAMEYRFEHTRPYGDPIGRDVDSREMDGRGTQIVATWDAGALSFAVDGRDCGPALTASEQPRLPGSGALWPFVCLFGSSTAVSLGEGPPRPPEDLEAEARELTYEVGPQAAPA